MTESAPYVELHAHSFFSLLDGASSPEELVAAAAALGMPALALTDHDAVYGAPRFVRAAREAGIQPILGAELTLAGGQHLTLLVQEEAGWHNLCRLIALGRHNAAKGEAALPAEALADHSAGLIALSGCRQGAIPAALLRREREQALQVARHYAQLFGRERFWIELQQHLLPEDQRLNYDLAALAQHLRLGVVATNNVHYAQPDRHLLQQVLICIRHNTTLDEATQLRSNSEFYLKSGAQLAPLFRRTPQALLHPWRIAQRCSFTLRYGLQDLPAFPTPTGMDAERYLHQLCAAALQKADLPSNARQQVAHELRIIQASGLANYFLIVWDIARFAREQGILCQGRGSAANSLVAYLLGISPVNPLAHDLVFERFLSAERQVVPDIDIDFDAARREEVIQYIYARYGLEHAAMAATFVTFRARSALRDVGKAFGLPLELLDQVNTALDIHQAQPLEAGAALPQIPGVALEAQVWQQIFALSQQLLGFPRHLGIHNGGMVITGSPLATRVPTEPATMAQRFVTQWDKEGLEELGLVKIDILGLRMLSALTEAARIAAQLSGQPLDLDQLRFDDPAVYDLICSADTVGVFQVESRAQAQVLPRLRPRCFNDLIVSISLIRPGPIQGDMVHPYLRRRLGLDPVTYLHPRLEPALRETLGVILFQEQVLKVARDLAGFTPGQGELLRRALGAKDPTEAVERLRADFLAGAAANGIAQADAALVFDKLRAFGGYSFPKSHAAAFAVLVYRSAWLKRYHPAAFYTALLNHQPMGFWTPAVLINDARRHGITTAGVDIDLSQADCSATADHIRLGLRYVRGLSAETAQQIVAARADRPFSDLAEFCQRTRLPRSLVENLIAAGAMDGWGASRRTLFWNLGLLPATPDGLALPLPEEPVHLPPLSHPEQHQLEIAMTGLTTGDPPLQAWRPQLRQRGILSSADLPQQPSGTSAQAAGLLVVHQAPPTAKGYRFLTLEDELGFINVIIRPAIYLRFRRIIRTQPLLLVAGEVQQEGGVTNLLARQFWPLRTLGASG